MKSTLQPAKSKIGSGRNITRMNERLFARGTLMFIEGEHSTEMFILRSGRIRILRQEGDKTIELAVLGAGSVLGELSLLDHQPRSASAQVVEDVVATVIDEAMFSKTMEAIPNWLSNIIRVVVTRLRDTMKRTSDSIVQKSVAGVIRVLLLLHNTEGVEQGEKKVVPLKGAKRAISAAIGLGDIEAENVFLHLIFKDMLFIRKSDAGREFIVLRDPGALQLYMNYLRAAQRGTKLLGQELSEAAVALLRTVVEAGERGGRQLKPGIYRVGLQQVEVEQQRRGESRHVNLDAFDELVNAKIVFKEEDTVRTEHQSHKRTVILYNADTMGRVLNLHHWLAVFKEEIVF